MASWPWSVSGARQQDLPKRRIRPSCPLSDETAGVGASGRATDVAWCSACPATMAGGLPSSLPELSGTRGGLHLTRITASRRSTRERLQHGPCYREDRLV